VKRAKCFQISQAQQLRNQERYGKRYDPLFDFKPFEVIEQERELYEEMQRDKSFFYPWECLSLIANGTTIDFVVKDQAKLFALLSVLNHLINKVPI
jgi:hypothetical protein